jgi:hypothetical protein
MFFAVLVLLLLLGGAAVWAGARAIDQQQFEVRWRATRGFMVGPFGWAQSASGIDMLQGADAIRVGIGLSAFGSMFITWAIGLFSLLFRYRLQPEPSRLGIVLGWISLTCLIVTCGSLFPFWKLWALSFYLVVLLLSLLCVRGLRSSTVPPGIRLFFPAYIVAVIVVSLLPMEQSRIQVGCLVVGLFVAFGGVAHVCTLIPSLRRKIESKEAEGSL